MALLVLLALVVACVGYSGIFAAYPNYQSYDGVYFVRSIQAVRASVMRYGEAPLWNPYDCGGVPLWDNPQSLTASPLLWLLLPLGSENALRAWHVLHAALGFLSMWLLARRDLGIGRAGALLASVIWAFAGFHWQHATAGHASFASFQYLPLALYLSRRSETSSRHAVLFGALLANVLLEGGTYPAPFLAVALLFEAAVRLTTGGRLVAAAKGGLLSLLFAVGFAAPKLLPLLDQFQARERHIPREPDTIPFSDMWEMLTARVHDRTMGAHRWEFHEYGAYVGLLAIGCAALGIALVLIRRKNDWLIGPLSIGILFVYGDFSESAPWSYLNQHVFPFKDMRVPARWVVLIVFSVAALAGVGFDELARRIRAHASGRTRLVTLATWVLVALPLLVAYVDLLSAPFPFTVQRFHESPPPHLPAAPRLYVGGPDVLPPLALIPANHAALECFEDWGNLLGAPLFPGDVPQARSLDKAVKITSATRTQNTFWFDAQVEAPGGRVLLNTNYDRNFRTTVGNVVRHSGALAVDLPPGTAHVEVAYRPVKLPIGLVTFALTALAAVVLIFRERRRKA